MNRILPIPLCSFFRNAFYCGGFSGRGLLHAFPWLIKTTVLEPLRWIELAAHSKKIKVYNITKPPLFILGYYRSGTTYLQQLLMQDDRLGYHSLYQAIFPELMLTFEKAMTPALEFLARLSKSRNHFHRTPLTWYSPGEEDIALLASANAVAAQTGILFPEKAMDFFNRYALFENISNNELKEWQDSYLYLLKKISICNNNKPLVLKSPLNSARIKQLLAMFPGARFIYISRDPVNVYTSSKRLWEMIRKKYVLGKFSKADTGKIILDTYSKTMARYMKDKILIPPELLTEICYENFIQEPVHTMENIYCKLNLGDFGYCKEAITAYAGAQKTYKVLDHHLAANEMNMIQQQLAPYIEYWKNIKERTDA